MSARDATSRSGRRRFLLTTLAAGLGASLPAPVLAQASGAARRPRAERPAMAPGAAPPSNDARALAALLKRRYPNLDAVKLAGITRELDQRLDGGKRLRAVKLANAAEPDTTFHA